MPDRAPYVRSPLLSHAPKHHGRSATQFHNANLGSGLVAQSQKMTVAASVMAAKKTVGQRS